MAIAASTVLSATLLSGCAWQSTPMVDSGSAKPLTAAGLSESMAAAIKGVRQVHMVVDDSNSVAAIDFDGSGTEFKARITLTRVATSLAPAKTAYLLFVGDYVYARAALKDKWVKAPAKPGTNASGQYDPASLLQKFSKGAKSIKDAGKTTIDGVSVRQYDVTLDAAAIAGSSANLGASSEVHESFFLTTDNKPRRIVLSLPGGVGDTQIDFTNWGKSANIEAPAASEIAPAAK